MGVLTKYKGKNNLLLLAGYICSWLYLFLIIFMCLRRAEYLSSLTDSFVSALLSRRLFRDIIWREIYLEMLHFRHRPVILHLL